MSIADPKAVAAVQIRMLSVQEFRSLAAELVSIYLKAMQYPTEIFGSRLRAWLLASQRPGFRAVIATTIHPQTGAQTALGVGYGQLLSTSHSWSATVADFLSHPALRAERGQLNPRLSAQTARELLDDCYEIAELHVLPGFQGYGIGRQLLRQLTKDLSYQRVLLSTPEVPAEANRAFSLYRSLGFVDLLRNFRFEGDNRDFAILYAPLPLAATPAS